MLWKTIKDRIYAFKEVWAQQPVVRWLLGVTIIHSVIGGWIYGPLILRFDGVSLRLFIFQNTGIMSGFLILLFLKAFLMKRGRELNHFAVLIFGTIGRSLLIPFYAFPSVFVFALICLVEGFFQVLILFTLSTLYKTSLPKRQEKHLGPTWVNTTLWAVIWAVVQPFGFLYINQGGNLWIWAGLGSLLALASLIPLYLGKNYIQSVKIEEEEEDGSPTGRVTNPIKMFLILFLITGGIYIVENSLRILPLYMDDPTLGGIVLSVGAIMFTLGGLISVLFSEHWVKPAIHTVFVLIGVCALLFTMTNHWLVILAGVIIIQVGCGIFQQLFSHRMVVNQKNKMLGVALPSMLGNICSSIAFLVAGTLAPKTAFLVLSLIMLLPIVLFKQFQPYLKVPRQES